MLMTSSFVCVTPNLGRKKSTGMELSDPQVVTMHHLHQKIEVVFKL